MNSDSTLPFTASPIEGMILDMDGTLLDTERLYKACTLAVIEEMGWGRQVDLVRDMVGLSSAKCEALMTKVLGSDFPLDVYRRAFLAMREERSRDGIALKKGAIVLLDELERLHFPMAIATSSSREAAERHLTLGGIRERFSTVVTVDDVIEAKPNPALYLLAANRLGLDPQRCAAVEDSHAGVLAASAAGMTTLMVPDIHQPDPELSRRCVAVLPDLIAVRDWLTHALTGAPAM